MTNYNFNTIVNMAKEIVLNIGHAVTSESDDYKSIYYGQRYDYDKLRIIYNDINKEEIILTIYLDNTMVLSYNFTNHKRYFFNGKWTKLIKIIYNSVPIIIEEREKAKGYKELKKNDLRSLKDYFSYIVECNNNENIYNYLKNKLSNYNIFIKKDKRYKTEKELCQGDEYYIPYYVYTIYYYDQPVAEFYDDINNPIPNIDFCIEKFIPGNWTNYFKKCVIQTQIIGNRITQRRLDNNADEIINNFKRKLNK